MLNFLRSSSSLVRAKRSFLAFLFGNIVLGSLIGCALLWGCFIDCSGMIFGLEGREAMIANSLENPAEQIALIGEELSNMLSVMENVSLMSFQIGCILGLLGFVLPVENKQDAK